MVSIGGEPIPGGPSGQGREDPVGWSGHREGAPDVEGLDATASAGEFLRDGRCHGGSGHAVTVDDQIAIDPLQDLVGDGRSQFAGRERLPTKSHVMSRGFHRVERVPRRERFGQVTENAGICTTVRDGNN